MHQTPTTIFTLAIIAITIACALPFVDCHYTAPSIADVTIHSVASGSIVVQLPDSKRPESIRAECKFTYRTDENGARQVATPKPVPTTPVANGRVNVIDVAKQLEGACISSTSDYWSYEVRRQGEREAGRER